MMPAILPDFAHMSPVMQQRVVCSVKAAALYQIPTAVLLAVAETENGKPGQWVRNTNGSFDIGQMQINTSYVAELGKYGIRAEHVAAPGCYSFDLAAWRLRQHITKDVGSFWRRVANYNSRNPQPNQVYQSYLMPRATKWDQWLRVNAPSGVFATPFKSSDSASNPAVTVASLSKVQP